MNSEKNSNIYISIVIPIYNCSKSLNILYDRLGVVLTKIANNYEIIMINDASPDNAWELIEELSKKDKRVKGINLSRNFGQHYAITAGLDYINGDWIVVMDCDLQDQPEEIVKLYKKSQEGYDIVVGERKDRKDSFFTKFTSKMFYIIFNFLTDQELDNKVANFGIYSREVIENIKKYKENDRSFGLLAVLVGFSRVKIEVNHDARAIGKSSYNFKKRVNMAIDHILSHSNKPLLMIINLGFLFSVFSFAYTILLIIRFFAYGNIADGWTSIVVSIFFLSGLILSSIGMVGLYIGKIYSEVKERPLYIIKKTTFKNK